MEKEKGMEKEVEGKEMQKERKLVKEEEEVVQG